MKFKIAALIVIIILVGTLLTMPFFAFAFFEKAHAQNIVPTEENQRIPNPIRFGTLEEAIYSVINIAYLAAGLVAVIYLIIGGYQYIISSGNPDAVEGAKATILNSIIGLVIIILSYLIIHYILTVLGAGGLIPIPR